MDEGTHFKEFEKRVLGLRQHQEMQEKRVEDPQGVLEVLNSKMDLLLEAMNGGRTSCRGRNEEEFKSKHSRVSSSMHVRSIKLDFSRFDRENPTGWIYKANHYFGLHPMPDGQKILMSSFYMEGSALIWFQDVEETWNFSACESFVATLQLRLGIPLAMILWKQSQG